ncbi:DUF1670 domain-containing protein [Candidatus Poribacteria bacterium]|nr:DUF1670 domain-containing protein [Candidatus Poribacteria bacterium]
MPYRGSVHDIGPTLTHKVQAIERILAGEPLSEVASALNHSLGDIERYYKTYNQVEMATTICDDISNIAAMTAMSSALVEQYYHLVEKYAPQKMLKNQNRSQTNTNP